ncbi:MAG: hypothetical protein IIZ69_09715 [Pseudomonas sp.]|nr:hypothetical protein [Pseudomonas sp.]
MTVARACTSHQPCKTQPTMDEVTKRRAYKTLDNLEREHARAVEMASTGVIQ